MSNRLLSYLQAMFTITFNCYDTKHLASSCTMLTYFTVGLIQQDLTSYGTIANIHRFKFCL